MVKHTYFWVFDETRELIGLVSEKSAKSAKEKVKGSFVLNCYGNWVVNICYYLTKGSIIE